jgi:membrane protease YdiL (CAAX protease family)
VLFINNVRLFKSKFRILDLKFVLLSFSLPIMITYSISVVEKTSINFNYFNADIFFLFFPFFIYALFKEIICRFAMLSICYNSTIKYFQIFSSSLMFSLFHFGNNSIDSIPFIVLFLSGIILSFIYLKTNLLTATIAHAFWNFSSSVLMGGNVSGFKLKYSLFIFVHLQDDIINGGKFGIEGSIITLLILLSICLITILKNRNPTILNVQD